MIGSIETKLTVMVNSCDSYSDLWIPFFTLYKKYADDLKGVKLLLNTESEEFSFEGLQIECIHQESKTKRYGDRMINALNHVNTPYVLMLLDDFFIREPVKTQEIGQIISWMDNDITIAYFNCDATPVYAELENNKYCGYHRIPMGNEYTLNMQAAIWRTDVLRSFWNPFVNPWEWETVYNLKAASSNKFKFYCVAKLGMGFINYGFDINGMGVFRGKWVRDDVMPLFSKEGISVDFNQRGFYSKNEIRKTSFKDKPLLARNLQFWFSQIKLMQKTFPEYLLSYLFFSVGRIFRHQSYTASSYSGYKLMQIREKTNKECL